MKPSLSALIIAKDEERDLPGCLESLKGLADEIVVLIDDSTTDSTERIAREAGCKVARRKFDGYAKQRQAALEICTKDWVLWVDADERATPELRATIPPLIGGQAHAEAYFVPFRVQFLGRVLRFGGLGREKHPRLFMRKNCHFVGDLLHEELHANGNSPVLPAGLGSIVHESYRDISDYMSKLDRYTTLSAEKKFAEGKRFRPWHHLIFPWEFFSRAVFRLGFLDGYPGLVWAWLSARHSALKYAKLRELELKK